MNQKNYASIPASMLPELEAWGMMTARLFGQLRHQAGLKPVHILESQEWFWTKPWQTWEKDADNDIASGRVKTFDNVNDLIESLDA